MLDIDRIDRLRRSYGDSRPLDRIRAHCDIEIRLAQKLRQASKQDRPILYTLVYDELFRSRLQIKWTGVVERRLGPRALCE
jgi:hypothetical protein